MVTKMTTSDRPNDPRPLGGPRGPDRRSIVATIIGMVALAFAALWLGSSVLGGDGGEPVDVVGAPPGSVSDPEVDAIALVPGEALLDEWQVVQVSESPMAGQLSQALVVPANTGPDLEQGVVVEILPFQRNHWGTEVTVGQLNGWFVERTEYGNALLAIGDGERSIELSAAPGTRQETLVGLADHLDLDQPIASLDPGPDWEVVVTSATVEDAVAYEIELQSDDGSRTMYVGSWSRVDPSAIALIDLPFLVDPVQVRGNDGLASLVNDADNVAGAIWLEQPHLIVTVGLRDRGATGPAREAAMLEAALGLVTVDAEGWAAFLEAHDQPTSDDGADDPELSGVDEIAGALADGRTFLVSETPGQGVCVVIADQDRGCNQWDGGDPLRPVEISEPEPDGHERTVLIFGQLPDDVVTVEVGWGAGAGDEATVSDRLWAAGVPEDGIPVSLTFWGSTDRSDFLGMGVVAEGVWYLQIKPYGPMPDRSEHHGLDRYLGLAGGHDAG